MTARCLDTECHKSVNIVLIRGGLEPIQIVIHGPSMNTVISMLTLMMIVGNPSRYGLQISTNSEEHGGCIFRMGGIRDEGLTTPCARVCFGVGRFD